MSRSRSIERKIAVTAVDVVIVMFWLMAKHQSRVRVVAVRSDKVENSFVVTADLVNPRDYDVDAQVVVSFTRPARDNGNRGFLSSNSFVVPLAAGEKRTEEFVVKAQEFASHFDVSVRVVRVDRTDGHDALIVDK